MRKENSKWYVVHCGELVNVFYSADKLGNVISLAKAYKACYELSNNRPCRCVCVVKISENGEWYADGTEEHYV